jgi:hypothetical protein
VDVLAQMAFIKELTSKLRTDFEAAVVRAIDDNPELSYEKIGNQFGLWASRVAAIAAKHGRHRARGTKPRTLDIAEVSSS